MVTIDASCTRTIVFQAVETALPQTRAFNLAARSKKLDRRPSTEFGEHGDIDVRGFILRCFALISNDTNRTSLQAPIQ